MNNSIWEWMSRAGDEMFDSFLRWFFEFFNKTTLLGIGVIYVAYAMLEKGSISVAESLELAAFGAALVTGRHAFQKFARRMEPVSMDEEEGGC